MTTQNWKKTTPIAQLALVTALASTLAPSVQADEHNSANTTYSAIDNPVHNTAYNDNDGTYWGLGIGSVLGAVIAGPPGAAIGATLGGALGWGNDKDEALDANIKQHLQTKQTLASTELQLHRQRTKHQEALHKERQKVSELSQANADKSAQISYLSMQQEPAPNLEDKTLLESLAAHYQQEVFFKLGDKSVPTYAHDRMAQLSEFLKKHPDLSISLTGHADQRGPIEFNKALAQARAESVRDMLIEQGISERRIQLQTMGESKAMAQAGDTGNYILDRRVAIELSLQTPSPIENNAVADENDAMDTVLAEATP